MRAVDRQALNAGLRSVLAPGTPDPDAVRLIAPRPVRRDGWASTAAWHQS